MRVPTEKDFADQGTDYINAEDLKALAETIIATRPGMAWRAIVGISYFWKRMGGQSHGKAKGGECSRCNKLQRHLLGTEFVIWLAADHCRFLDGRQIEAVLHHELHHIHLNEDGRPYIAGHDSELFLADLREYGAWNRDLQAVVELVEQLRLPLPA